MTKQDYLARSVQKITSDVICLLGDSLYLSQMQAMPIAVLRLLRAIAPAWLMLRGCLLVLSVAHQVFKIVVDVSTDTHEKAP